ncbi:MAG: glycerol-3-phosphate acyltransferase [Erysipelotrichaceae bacterium]|nr:glycerol-3-phosphate acyltransferase [Erysipelotrichaceae bacterium]
MYRIISFIIGYTCGNFLTAEVVSYKVSENSSFHSGSKNSGMANIISLYGIKYGIIVLISDLIKTFIPCLLCQYVLFPQHRITVAYTGLGVICGHNYSIWYKFIGGKGVTCTCGV